MAAIAALDRAAGGLEYVEQPSRPSRTSPLVRRRVDVPIAADESIRRAADPYRVRDLEAADVAVLKVQPLGGVRACLRIAEDIGLPVVVSSALETSVGHRRRAGAGRGPARAALRLRPRHRAAAHRRRRGRSAAAGRRRAARRRARGRRGRARPAGRAARPGRALGGAGCAEVRGDDDATDAGPRRGRSGCSTPASSRSWSRPAAATRRSSFAAYDAAQAGLLRLHTRLDERSAGFLALGLTRAGPPGRGDLHLRHRRRQPAPGRARGRPRRRRRWSSSPPTGRPGCAAPAPTRPPTRSASSARWSPDHDLAAAGRPPGRPTDGPVHLNVQLDEPLLPDGPLDARAARPSRGAAPAPVAGTTGRCRSGPRTVVVAGDDAGPPARRLAEARRLAAARRAVERLAHRRPRAALLPAAARHRPRRRRSSGSSSSAARRCRARSPGCSAATTSRCCRCRPAGSGPSGRSRSPAARPAYAVDGPTTPAWLDAWREADRVLGRRLDALLAAEPDLTPYEVAGAVSRALPPGGCWSSARRARSATST